MAQQSSRSHHFRLRLLHLLLRPNLFPFLKIPTTTSAFVLCLKVFALCRMQKIIYQDNTTAMASSKTPLSSRSLRHIIVRIYNIPDLVRQQHVSPLQFTTSEQHADMCTVHESASGNLFYFVAIFSKIVACVTAGIMRIYQYSIRIHFSVCLDLYF